MFLRLGRHFARLGPTRRRGLLRNGQIRPLLAAGRGAPWESITRRWTGLLGRAGGNLKDRLSPPGHWTDGQYSAWGRVRKRRAVRPPRRHEGREEPDELHPETDSAGPALGRGRGRGR